MREYWIVDPTEETITVLRLEGNDYVSDGVYRRGARASSVVLKGFSAEVVKVLDSAKC